MTHYTKICLKFYLNMIYMNENGATVNIYVTVSTYKEHKTKLQMEISCVCWSKI